MQKFLQIAAILGTTLLFTACGNGGNEEVSQPAQNEQQEQNQTANNENEVAGDDTTLELAPVQIDFWHAMTGVHQDGIDNLIAAFNQVYPHITVNDVFQGNYSALNQAIIASAVAGTLPHLTQATTENVIDYWMNDLIIPLGQFMYDPELGMTTEEINDIVTTFRQMSTWGDEWYSIPFGKSTRILFYNRDVLEAHGFDAPPTTWDELKHIAETVATDTMHGMSFENAYDAEFYALLIQHGAVHIDEATATAHFASPEGVQALSVIYNITSQPWGRFAGEDGFNSGIFGSGRTAMSIGSSAGIPHVTNAIGDSGINWGTAPIPGTELNSATRFAGNDMVMFNTGTSAEQEAAWKFMRFILQPYVTAYWAIDTGYIPVRYSAMELPFFVEYLENNPVHRAASAQFDQGFFTARVGGANAVVTALREELENIMLGIKTIEQGLEDAQNRANEILAANN